MHSVLICSSRPSVAAAVADGPITIHYNGYTEGSKIGTPQTLEVDMVIGADGANSRVAKEIDAGEYDYAIAFQERIRIPGG
jgi:geranylgeranyl reductase